MGTALHENLALTRYYKLISEVYLKIAKLHWPTFLFIVGYHVFLLIALPIYFLHHTPSWGILAASALLLLLTGLSITAGYHRLFSHTAYKVNPVVEGILLFFATMATQGSALRWCFDHRHHHAFVDTDRDPYSIKKGFWFAHCLWFLNKQKEIESRVVSDLLRKPLIRFQDRFYAPLMVLTNGLTTLFVGWCFGDYLGAFLFAWLVRLFFLHHFTWFINSLAHTWGARTFSQELTAVDNYVIALLTFGEGYHNFHHTYANDYRNGIRWYHFDPTKWLIWTLNKLGLAHNLKRNHDHTIQERILSERKQVLLDKVGSISGDTHVWEDKITKISDNILAKIKQAKELGNLYLKEKQEKNREHVQSLRSQIKAIKKELKVEARNWMNLSQQLNKLSTNSSQPSE